MNKSDINLSEIEFDHEGDYVKKRVYGGNVSYVQNGIKFNSGFVATEILEIIDPAAKDIDDMSPDELRDALRASRQPTALTGSLTTPLPKPKKKRADAKPATPRQSADDKLSAYKAPEKPDFVTQALSENSAALKAEERAE